MGLNPIAPTGTCRRSSRCRTWFCTAASWSRKALRRIGRHGCCGVALRSPASSQYQETPIQCGPVREGGIAERGGARRMRSGRLAYSTTAAALCRESGCDRTRPTEPSAKRLGSSRRGAVIHCHPPVQNRQAPNFTLLLNRSPWLLGCRDGNGVRHFPAARARTFKTSISIHPPSASKSSMTRAAASFVRRI